MLKGVTVSLSRLIICVCSSSLIIISIVYSSGPVGDYFNNLNWTPGNTGPETSHEGATWPSFGLNSRKKVLLPAHSQTDNYNADSTPSIPDTMPFRTVLMNRSSLPLSLPLPLPLSLSLSLSPSLSPSLSLSVSLSLKHRLGDETVQLSPHHRHFSQSSCQHGVWGL